jgi:SAM-dependent methyltransferase
VAKALSARLAAVVDALALEPGMRVLEIGCGPGAMAREIAARIGDGHVLGIDRSAKAIASAEAASQAEIAAGKLSFRQVAVEDIELLAGEPPYDIAIAVRVGALDGRHPEARTPSHAPHRGGARSARTAVHRRRQSAAGGSAVRLMTPARGSREAVVVTQQLNPFLFALAQRRLDTRCGRCFTTRSANTKAGGNREAKHNPGYGPRHCSVYPSTCTRGLQHGMGAQSYNTTS